eukprot:31457-Pelagococcus_subviridis.AAC.7
MTVTSADSRSCKRFSAASACAVMIASFFSASARASAASLAASARSVATRSKSLASSSCRFFSFSIRSMSFDTLSDASWDFRVASSAARCASRSFASSSAIFPLKVFSRAANFSACAASESFSAFTAASFSSRKRCIAASCSFCCSAARFAAVLSAFIWSIARAAAFAAATSGLIIAVVVVVVVDSPVALLPLETCPLATAAAKSSLPTRRRSPRVGSAFSSSSSFAFAAVSKISPAKISSTGVPARIFSRSSYVLSAFRACLSSNRIAFAFALSSLRFSRTSSASLCASSATARSLSLCVTRVSCTWRRYSTWHCASRKIFRALCDVRLRLSSTVTSPNATVSCGGEVFGGEDGRTVGGRTMDGRRTERRRGRMNPRG